MDLEESIRSRIESILANDARGYAEIEKMAAADEPLEHDAFEEERNLYQRIISNYRSACSEVNALFEQNVGFLSGFYRIVETIKEKRDFTEISTAVVTCVLKDLRAEYAALVFFGEPETSSETSIDGLAIEGVCEEQQLVRIHAERHLLGSRRFIDAVAKLLGESVEASNIGDVYRDARFDAVDFPSVVRSLVCLPVDLGGRAVGALLLGHSQPNFFDENHLRVFKILASAVAHLRLLTSAFQVEPAQPAAGPVPGPDGYSVVLLGFQLRDRRGGSLPLDRDTLRRLQAALATALEPSESLVIHRDGELLAMLPGIGSDALPARVRRLREAFERFQPKVRPGIHMTVGFAACETGNDLARILELASVMLHPDLELAGDSMDCNGALQP